jgi:hypothetical protein
LRFLKRGAKRATPIPAEHNDTLVEELEEFAGAVHGNGQPEGRRVEVKEVLA